MEKEKGGWKYDDDENMAAMRTGSPKRSNMGPPKWRSTRFCLAYLISTGLMVVFFQRVSFSMAIVCMVNHTAVKQHHHHHQHLQYYQEVQLQNQGQMLLPLSNSSGESTYNRSAMKVADIVDEFVGTITTVDDDKEERKEEEQCGGTTDDEKAKEDGPFNWDKHLQGLLLGALYWGFCVIQVPGSYLIQRKGARLVIGVGVVVMSLLHVLCHVGALWSPWAVFTLRVGVGLCSGLTIPGMYSVWGRWAPVAERTQLLSLAFAGQMIANASVFPVSAAMCRHGFWGGWPTIFYTFGALGLLWAVMWFAIISDTPETHSRISPAERDYILRTRSAVGAHKEKMSVPWKRILTAPCFWAIAVSQFTYNWGFFLMLSNLPTFFYETMNFDIQSNGVYSMLPYLFLFVTMAGAGFVADVIISRGLLSIGNTRKLFTVVGYLSPAVLLVVMSHQDCGDVTLVMALLVTSVGMTGVANTGGYYINPYDIAPRFATAICTATNTMATAAGVINPYVVAAVTVDETREQWRVVFYITATIFALGAFFFCIFAEGDVQPWAATCNIEKTVVPDDDNDCKKTMIYDCEKLDLSGTKC